MDARTRCTYYYEYIRESVCELERMSLLSDVNTPDVCPPVNACVIDTHRQMVRRTI